MPPEAVIFDLDGVIVETEQIWADVRRELVRECGGRWHDGAEREMQGMSSPEWSRFLHDELGVELPPATISNRVVRGMLEHLDADLPLLPHAAGAVRDVARTWPLGLASSANRPVVERVLERAGLTAEFAAVVSSEEVEHGKPAPDVYLAVARLLGAPPERCVAVEDSANGIRSAVAARMRTVAIPNRAYPPDDATLGTAARVLDSLAELTPDLVREL